MAVPEVARGAILDAQRLLAFKFEEPVNVLVFYSQAGAELGRVDHWWNANFRKGRGRNFDEDRIRIVEDGSSLDAILSATETVKYQVETTPPTLSEPYEVTVADRPQPGRNREWALTITKAKYKSRHFGPPVR